MNQLTNVALETDLSQSIGETLGENMGLHKPASLFLETPRSPMVAILLCTYNGEQFLAEQLESLAAQTHAQWQLHVSDDGSRDGTLAILKSFQEKWGADRMFIYAGPSKGFAANFLSLTCRHSISADYYAYADQDDVWEEQKLDRALQWLQSIPIDVPGLYCARTRLVDANNIEIGLSPLFSKQPSFSNALMQNIGSGNTMVFNHAARALLYEAGEDVSVVVHDWWAYIVIAGCGGRVLYDPYPTLRYRQHEKNLIGMNSNWAARWRRIRMSWHGSFRQWNDCHITALQKLNLKLSPKSLETVEIFIKLRETGFVRRIILFKSSGLYRQTPLGNIGLMVAVLFRKL